MKVTIFLFFITSIFCAACASSPDSVPTPPVLPPPQAPPASPTRRYLDHAEPAEMPAWVPGVPQSETELYVVGVSRGYSAIADARENARADARNQVLRYYGQFLQARAVETSSFTGRSGEAFITLVDGEEEIISFAQAIVSQVAADNYYTEFYKVIDDKGNARDEYVAYVLCEVSREKVTRDIDNYARNISEPYAALLRSPQDSLAAQLGMYEHIIAALINNPLYRSTAYYDSSSGRTNLYDYVMVQLINAARSVSFDPLPTQSVEKGDSLSIVVQARSSLAQKIGGLDCALILSGKNNPAPPHNALVDADNAIRFEIRTGQLETGTYNVSLELLLHKAAPHAARNQNPMMGFSFEVTPAAGSIVFEGDSLSDAEQRDLIQAVQQAIQNHRVPLQKGVIFTVTLSSRKSAEPISGTEIILCDVSLSMTFSGAVGASSWNKRLTEFSQNGVIRLAGNFIRDNTTFWQSVNEYLSR